MPYVESPLDRIVAVQWGAPLPPPGVNLVWQAVGINPDNLFDAGQTTMAVSVVNLPLASPATLMVPSDPSGHGALDQTVFAEFPDGAGRLQAQYNLSQVFATLELKGSVFYVTNAAKPYGGASSVVISLAITLRDQFMGAGWNWNATAFCGEASATTSGTAAASAGEINLTATMIIKPPSVFFG
jgi:hypothetical protein